MILFQLSFRGKECIRYLKQKMASGKGFHVVSKLLSAMLHHIIGLAPPTLYTVSPCTLGLRKFWRIVIKLPVGLFFFFSRNHSRTKCYCKGISNKIKGESFKCQKSLKVFYTLLILDSENFWGKKTHRVPHIWNRSARRTYTIIIPEHWMLTAC